MEKLMKVSKEFKWVMGHRLMNDPGKCKNIHGHNYRAILTIVSRGLTKDGMIINFSKLSGEFEEFKRKYDHTLMLNPGDHFLSFFEEENMMNGKLQTKLTKCIYGEPTAENIARMFIIKFRDFLTLHNTEYKSIEVKLYETDTSSATVIHKNEKMQKM